MRNRLVLIPLLAGFLAAFAVGESASVRKDFVEKIRQSTLKKDGSRLVAGYNVTVEGPDSTFFVYHASVMNASICRGVLTKGVVSKFRELGFTKLVCTDDGNTTFAFDAVEQTVTPAVARKDFVETIRESAVKEWGGNAPMGFNISAEGPDATYYVLHQAEVNSSECRRMLTERFILNLRARGFVQVSCTDDKNTTLSFPIEPHSSESNSRSRPALP